MHQDLHRNGPLGRLASANTFAYRPAKCSTLPPSSSAFTGTMLHPLPIIVSEDTRIALLLQSIDRSKLIYINDDKILLVRARQQQQHTPGWLLVFEAISKQR
jgi:hypothetical protein